MQQDGAPAHIDRPDHDGLSEKKHINFNEPHMWPPNSPDIIPWIRPTLFGVLFSNESTTNDNSRRWKK